MNYNYCKSWFICRLDALYVCITHWTCTCWRRHLSSPTYGKVKITSPYNKSIFVLASEKTGTVHSLSRWDIDPTRAKHEFEYYLMDCLVVSWKSGDWVKKIFHRWNHRYQAHSEYCLVNAKGVNLQCYSKGTSRGSISYRILNVKTHVRCTLYMKQMSRNLISKKIEMEYLIFIPFLFAYLTCYLYIVTTDTLIPLPATIRLTRQQGGTALTDMQLNRVFRCGQVFSCIPIHYFYLYYTNHRTSIR